MKHSSRHSKKNPPYLRTSYQKLVGAPVYDAWERFSTYSQGKLIHPGNSRTAWSNFWFAVKNDLPTTCRAFVKLRAKTGLGPASPREMVEMCLHAAKMNPKARRNPTHIDHAAYQAKVRKMTEAQLHYTMRDARDAVRAHPEGHKAGYYEDEINYCASELARRRKGGVRENPRRHVMGRRRQIVNRAKQLARVQRLIKRTRKAKTPENNALRKMAVEYARALKTGCRVNPDDTAGTPSMPPVIPMAAAVLPAVTKTNPRRNPKQVVPRVSPALDVLEKNIWLGIWPEGTRVVGKEEEGSVVQLPNGHRKLILNQSALNRRYLGTSRYPAIQHSQVEDYHRPWPIQTNPRPKSTTKHTQRPVVSRDILTKCYRQGEKDARAGKWWVTSCGPYAKDTEQREAWIAGNWAESDCPYSPDDPLATKWMVRRYRITRENPRPKSTTKVRTTWFLAYGPDHYHWGHTVKIVPSARAALASTIPKGWSWVIVRGQDTLYQSGPRQVVKASDAATRKVACEAFDRINMMMRMRSNPRTFRGEVYSDTPANRKFMVLWKKFHLRNRKVLKSCGTDSYWDEPDRAGAREALRELRRKGYYTR